MSRNKGRPPAGAKQHAKPERGSERTQTRGPERGPNRKQDRVHTRGPERGPERGSARKPEDRSARGPDRKPERPPTRAPERKLERVPERKPERKPERAPERGPEREAERRPERARGEQRRESVPRGEVWIYGLHPVAAALRNPARKILRVLGTSEALSKLREDSEIDSPALAQAHPSGRHELDTVLGANAVHQGIAVLARTLELDLTEVLAEHGEDENICVMVLDQVTDPHNVGAILRSAAAFGAAAVIAPDRGAPDETGTMAKSASGALDVVPYIKGGNLVRVLEELKEQRFWLVGLEADGDKELSAMDLGGRIALVVGAEGEGLRRLVRETCDHLTRLPMRGAMESLNVSNAAAIALYEWIRQTQRQRP